MRIPFFGRRREIIPVLRLSGAIGMATPLRPGLSLATLAGPLEKAFQLSKVPAVAISINSPGGSPVQSNLIYQRIRDLAGEHKKRVHVFCEDVAASGGYFIAAAGDEIYADPSSIIGSIGVISAGFGFEKAIEKLGIERRVYTSGLSKGALDPFLPEKPDDIARLKMLQADVHEVFKSVIRTSRGTKLKMDDPDLFSGAFWSAARARDLGLIDGLGDMRSRLREVYGAKIELRAVSLGRPGLLSRLRRGAPSDVGHGSAAIPAWVSGSGFAGGGWADDALSALETRALWARFGL
jgi:signal peptide peptidase SppA